MKTTSCRCSRAFVVGLLFGGITILCLHPRPASSQSSISRQCIDETLAVFNNTLILTADENLGHCVLTPGSVTCDDSARTDAEQIVCNATGGIFFESDTNYYMCDLPQTTITNFTGYGLCVGADCLQSDYDAIAEILQEGMLGRLGFNNCITWTPPIETQPSTPRVTSPPSQLTTTLPPETTKPNATTPPSGTVSDQCLDETLAVFNSTLNRNARDISGNCTFENGSAKCDFSVRAAAIQATCGEAGGAFYESSLSSYFCSVPENTDVTFMSYSLCVGASCSKSEFETIAIVLEESALENGGFNSCSLVSFLVADDEPPSTNSSVTTPPVDTSKPNATSPPSGTTISQQCVDETLAVFNTSLFRNARETRGDCMNLGSAVACDSSAPTAAYKAICSDAGGTFFESNYSSYTCAIPQSTVVSFSSYGTCVGASCSTSEFETIAIVLQENILEDLGFNSCSLVSFLDPWEGGIEEPNVTIAPTTPPPVDTSKPNATSPPSGTTISRQCYDETLAVFNTSVFRNARETSGDCLNVGSAVACDSSAPTAAYKAICSDVGGTFFESNYSSYMCAIPQSTVVSFSSYGTCVGASCSTSEFETIAIVLQENILEDLGFNSCSLVSFSDPSAGGIEEPNVTIAPTTKRPDTQGTPTIQPTKVNNTKVPLGYVVKEDKSSALSHCRLNGIVAVFFALVVAAFGVISVV